MKTSLMVGIALIILGMASLVYRGVTYTTKEKIIDVGPLEASADKTRTILFSPIFGVAVLVGGVSLVVLGTRKV